MPRVLCLCVIVQNILLKLKREESGEEGTFVVKK